MKVSKIMTRFPKTIAPTDSLIRAWDLMVWGEYRHLPVLDPESDRLVGILSQRDITQHQSCTGESIWASPSDTVSMAMSEQVHTAGPDDSVAEVSARMSAERIGCLPITRMGKLVGLVTTTDALAAGMRVEGGTREDRGPTIGDIMSPNPRVTRADDYLLDAASRMSQYGLRHLPVVDGDNHVIGMLSDRDVRACIGDPARAFDEGLGVTAQSLRVRHAMSTPAVTTTVDQSCTEAARAFVELKASSVPVVDEANLLVGIVSYLDLLEAYASEIPRTQRKTQSDTQRPTESGRT